MALVTPRSPVPAGFSAASSGTVAIPTRLLLVEDSAADADLIADYFEPPNGTDREVVVERVDRIAHAAQHDSHDHGGAGRAARRRRAGAGRRDPPVEPARGGRVSLVVRGDDEALRFRVVDTGAGIPAARVPHLFDRFWQARETRRGGAGLGLAIARGIGQGSTFTLVLPHAEE